VTSPRPKQRGPRRRAAAVIAALALVGGLLSVAAPAHAAGVSVSGTVRGVDGGGTIPLGGAFVGLYPLTGSGEAIGFSVTDIAGNYVFSDVPPGKYRVRFDPPNTTHASTWLFGEPLEYNSALLNVTTVAVTGVNVTLPLGSVVTGQVFVDGSLGGTTTEVTLFRLDPDGRVDRFPLSARSRTNGNFGIAGVPQGTYVLRFGTDVTTVTTTYWNDAVFSTAATPIVVSGPPGTIGPFVGTVSTGGPQVNQLAGTDRYSTAVAISEAGWPDGANTVFIVNGQGFADALSAGAAAAFIDAPMLLVPRDDIPQGVADELTRLQPQSIYVIGGQSAVSESVYGRLLSYTSNTLQRLPGADRYATSRLVVDTFFGDGGSPFAYLATGANFPDALGAGPAAAVELAPLILVNGSAAAPDAATTNLLTDLGVSAARVVGGTSVISSAYEAALVSPGLPEVYRRSGPDRYSTAQAVGGAFRFADAVFFATGANFPDALAGSALAGAMRSPIFLVQPNCVPAEVLATFESLKPNQILLLGGTSVLGPGVLSLTPC
jgi:putative cell wall-binding protein